MNAIDEGEELEDLDDLDGLNLDSIDLGSFGEEEILEDVDDIDGLEELDGDEDDLNLDTLLGAVEADALASKDEEK